MFMLKNRFFIIILAALFLSACGMRQDAKPLAPGIVKDIDPNDGGDDDELLDDDDDDYDRDGRKGSNGKAKQGNDGETTTGALEIPAPMSGTAEQILKRKAYTVSYNKGTRLPNWVAWHLTRSHASGTVKRPKSAFHEDEQVPTPRATLNDYYNSRYDRGHMCPAGDNKWDETAMYESFLLTNICPQNHGLNDGDWKELEQLCRKWAERYGDIYIVCGPVFEDTKHKTIGKNKVIVPEAFFKVVLCTTGTPKAIGFIYKNKDGDRSMASYTTTVDNVESLTGIDFFPALPDDIENKIEAACSLKDW